MEELPPPGVRSLVSSDEVRFRFVNANRRPVAIRWIDYEGRAQMYCELNFKQYVDVDTYVTHPWMFRDAISGEHCVVDNAKIFYGKGNVAARTVKFICAPLRTLKKAALLSIVEQLSFVEEIDAFEIPATLKDELRSLMRSLTKSKALRLVQAQLA